MNDELLAVAAHELGHALLLHRVGVEVAVEVFRWPCRGETTEIGYLDTDDLDCALDYLSVLPAGSVAGNRWRDLHGLRPEGWDQSRDDRAEFQRSRYGGRFVTGADRIPAWFDATQAEIRAEKLVDLVWPRLEVLAPVLARRGRLTSKDL